MPKPAIKDQDLRKILERHVATWQRQPLARPRRRRWWIGVVAVAALVAAMTVIL